MNWKDLMTDIVIVSIGLILILGGLAFRIYVNRRRFYRRGLGGLQHYSRYSKAISSSVYERILLFLSIPAMILGMAVLFLWYVMIKDFDFNEENENRENIEKVDLDAKVHFLVPSEKGIGCKEVIHHIPINSFLSSRN